jgi:hypothetical protein
VILLLQKALRPYNPKAEEQKDVGYGFSEKVKAPLQDILDVATMCQDRDLQGAIFRFREGKAEPFFRVLHGSAMGPRILMGAEDIIKRLGNEDASAVLR